MVDEKRFADILNYFSHIQGDKTAFIELLKGNEINAISYYDLDIKIKKLCIFFQHYHLPGKSCVLFFSAGIDALATIIACMISGLIPIIKTINHNISAERFNFQFDALIQSIPDLTAIISTRHFFDRFQNENLDKFQQIIIDDADSINPFLPCIKQLTNQDTAMIQFTSGSTGIPKGLKISHSNLFYNLFYCSKIWDCNINSIIVTWAPHSHVFGLITGLLLPLYVGGTAIIMQPNEFSNDPLSWLENISKYQATHSGAPDFAYLKCVEHYSEKRMSTCSLKSWLVASSGGEMVKKETLNSFYQTLKKHGFNYRSFCPSYGMSENSGVVCSVSNQETPEFVAPNECVENNHITPDSIISVGKPLYQTNIIIVNPNTLLPIPEGHIGEILINSPSMFSGYVQNQQENDFIDMLFNLKSAVESKFNNTLLQFYRTGDLGFMKSGALYITGRLKEILIINGKNYSPHDIETCVLNHVTGNFLGKNAAFSIKKSKNSEVAILYQEIHEDCEEFNPSELQAKIKECIKKYLGFDLHDVVFLSENTIPMTVSNKIQRLQCKTHYLNELSTSTLL